ncbi:MAG: putative EndoIII-related endonuclease [Dehalococcoidia bacterium]|nr:putative EndoIII-related endonuclease [Dehalococcoidia bacterium]
MPSSSNNPEFVTSVASPNKTGQITPQQAFLLLEGEQGVARWEPRFDPISELIYTILSQHTSDVNALKAYHSLQEALGSWERVAQANPEEIAQAIWIGGLSRVKAPRIGAVLQAIQEECGKLDISFLKEMPLPQAKAWLRRLPGVGPKTAAIVLCFALGMSAMPVDTHVYRVSKRLEIIPSRATTEQAHDLLEAAVAPEQVFAFHVYLITHGRRVCKARRPLCQGCVLRESCPSAFRV